MVAGKKVVLIGSGATAVTILPSIAESAGHVTMVQRTPTYIRCKPEIDPVAEFMNKWLPEWLAVRINRWRAVLLGALFYQYCIRYYILHRNTNYAYQELTPQALLFSVNRDSPSRAL